LRWRFCVILQKNVGWWNGVFGGILVFWCGAFVVKLWWNAWQTWSRNGHFCGRQM